MITFAGGDSSNGDAAGLGIGEAGLLAQGDAFFLPGEFGTDEEVHIEGIAHVGIDELAILAVVLHARAHAAPHGLVRCRVVAYLEKNEFLFQC